MTKTISFVSGKGGAGKTTAAIMIAGEYQVQGMSVLIVDSDPRQNLVEWWKASAEKGNLPEKMQVATALRSNDLNTLVSGEGIQYDMIIIDTPGVDGQLRETVLRLSDLVVTPVQPNKDEVKAAGEAAAWIADMSDETGRELKQLILKTRISIPARMSEGYRLIRPFVERLQANQYNVNLIDDEMFERNCYKDIRSGYGTLQMMPISDTIKKARLEIQKITNSVSDALTQQ